MDASRRSCASRSSGRFSPSSSRARRPREIHAAARRRLESAAEAASTPILLVRPSGSVLYANRAAAALLSARSPLVVVPRDGRETSLATWIARLGASAAAGEKRRAVLADGRALEASVARFADEEEDDVAVLTLRVQSALSLDDVRERLATRGVSGREAEVVGAVLEGLRNAEIARRLFITEWTVKDHLKHVFSKLGVELAVGPPEGSRCGAPIGLETPAGGVSGPATPQNVVVGPVARGSVAPEKAPRPREKAFMFRLKKLEIQGFKSFVDKTSVTLPSRITAIVGPNGSGKSNICDAVQWVLGEQSARSLRGTTMEDVIFNGAARRRPLGMAEVALTLESRSGEQWAETRRRGRPSRGASRATARATTS